MTALMAENDPLWIPGEDDKSPLVECDICRVQVRDLSTHLYTAHFDNSPEKVVGDHREVVTVSALTVSAKKSSFPQPTPNWPWTVHRKPIQFSTDTPPPAYASSASKLFEGVSEARAKDAKIKCSLCFEESPFCSNHSIRYLSRYLKIITEEIDLEVPLCEECASLNEKFSELYKQLEKVQMEVTFCLSLIQGRRPKAEDISHEIETDFFGGLLRKLLTKGEAHKDKTGQFWNEAKKKCSKILGKVQPQIQLRRVTMDEVAREKTRLTPKPMPVFSPEDFQPHLDSKGSTASVGPDVEKNFNEDSPSEIDLGPVKVESYHCEPSQLMDRDPLGDDGESDMCDVNVKEFLDRFENQPEADVTDKAGHVHTSAKAYTKIWTPDKWVGKRHSFNSETNRYKCEICKEEFSKRVFLRYHDEQVHLGLKIKCDLCGRLFRHLPSFHRHYQGVHLSKKLECNLCGKKFSLGSNMRKHRSKGCENRKREPLHNGGHLRRILPRPPTPHGEDFGTGHFCKDAP